MGRRSHPLTMPGGAFPSISGLVSRAVQNTCPLGGTVRVGGGLKGACPHLEGQVGAGLPHASGPPCPSIQDSVSHPKTMEQKRANATHACPSQHPETVRQCLSAALGAKCPLPPQEQLELLLLVLFWQAHQPPLCQLNFQAQRTLGSWAPSACHAWRCLPLASWVALEIVPLAS